MASQELLNEFERFDDETLKKLITVGDSIMSPLDTELLSADYSSMLDEVFKPNGLADRYYPEWTDRSKSDFGRFLVELFALFSDKDFFYMNHYSKESFVLVADLYRSIFHQAQHQGFNPKSNVSATGEVELIFEAGNLETLDRGSVVLGIASLPDLTYVNKPFTIPQSTTSQNITVEFIQGKMRREQIFFDGYSLVLDVVSIVDSSIELTITNAGNLETWTQTDNFIGGTSATKHFMVYHDEDGRAEILFASGGLGAIPDAGTLCDISFLVGGGYIGDIQQNTLDRVLENQSVRNLESFTQSAMTGGNDLMPLELLRQTTIGKARHQNRVVTPEDAEFFCKELSFVSKVKANVFLNYVYVYILPTNGGAITQSQKDLIEDKLLLGNDGKPYLLMGYNLTVNSAVFVPLVINIDLYLLPTASRGSASIVSEQVVDEYLNPLKDAQFGVGINRSILASELLRRVSGSQNVTFPVLHRSGLVEEPSDISFIESEIVDRVNSVVNINIIGGI